MIANEGDEKPDDGENQTRIRGDVALSDRRTTTHVGRRPSYLVVHFMEFPGRKGIYVDI